MEYADIKEWLDGLVHDLENRDKMRVFNEQIKTVYPDDYIHMSCGIEIVAEKMGLDLTLSTRDDLEFKYKYSFMYRGFEFLQLSKERLV